MVSVLLKMKNLSESFSRIDVTVSYSGNVPLYLMGDNTKLVRFSTEDEAQAYICGISSIVDLFNSVHDFQISKSIILKEV